MELHNGCGTGLASAIVTTRLMTLISSESDSANGDTNVPVVSIRVRLASPGIGMATAVMLLDSSVQTSFRNDYDVTTTALQHTSTVRARASCDVHSSTISTTMAGVTGRASLTSDCVSIVLLSLDDTANLFLATVMALHIVFSVCFTSPVYSAMSVSSRTRGNISCTLSTRTASAAAHIDT